MAVETHKVRVKKQLKIKIGEAKALCGRGCNLVANSSNSSLHHNQYTSDSGGSSGYVGGNLGSSGFGGAGLAGGGGSALSGYGSSSSSSSSSNAARDVYCKVALDQEEIYRTSTIERTLDPFFGEEFQFEIPRTFRHLCVYVFDRDRHLKQDRPVGKVAIRRDDLQSYDRKDHWFALRPVDADSEVQGAAHVLVTFEGTQKITQQHQASSRKDNGSGSNSDEGVLLRAESLREPRSIRGAAMRSSATPLGHSESLNHNPRPSLPNTNQPPNNSTSASPFDPPLHRAPPVPGAPARVTIRVAECAELSLKNGACDPYAAVTALYTNGRKITRRTKARRKTECPAFEESFTFELRTEGSGGDSRDREGNHAYTVCPAGEADLLEISVCLWHDSPGMGGGGAAFLGELRIPLHGHQQREGVARDAWYRLQPRRSTCINSTSASNNSLMMIDSRRTPPGTRLSSTESSSGLGSLRLRLDYTEDRVFPEQTYDAWRDVLLESAQIQPITSSAVYLLGEIIKDKEHAAKPLVRLFTHHRKIVDIIRVLADHEISKLTDATTIFRGNTLVSKMMDEAMRLWGLPYLHRTLKSIVESIFSERKPCEIDPMRVKDISVIDNNLENLKDYVEKVFQAITDSAVHCPAVLCEIFHHLRESASRHFPQNKEVRFSVVSGFIFLRFFAPAILGPRLFDLTTEQMDDQTNRTLTLISKTIQSLGNLVSSRSAQQPAKEQYMCSLYKAICTERHVESVKRFLELVSTTGNICSSDNTQSSSLEDDRRNYGAGLSNGGDEVILLKEGMMTKRAQGRKRFGWKNFKARHFRLTTQSLSYSKNKLSKTPLYSIPLTEILAVEKLAEDSFKMKNMFQIVQQERVLYVQTSNCVELKEWVDVLNKVCHTNKNRLRMYHPCAFLNGQWQCCGGTSATIPGCTAVSACSSDLHMALDPAWDLQRLHSLLMKNLQAWEKIVRGCECQSVAGADRSLVNPVTEDPQSCLMTLMKLRDIAKNLEMYHNKLLGLEASQMRYGSRQAPIGDDNYFHLTARSKKDPSGIFSTAHDHLFNTANMSNLDPSGLFLTTDNGRHNSFALKASRQEIFKTIAVSLKQSIDETTNGAQQEQSPNSELHRKYDATSTTSLPPHLDEKSLWNRNSNSILSSCVNEQPITTTMMSSIRTTNAVTNNHKQIDIISNSLPSGVEHKNSDAMETVQQNNSPVNKKANDLLHESDAQ